MMVCYQDDAAWRHGSREAWAGVELVVPLGMCRVAADTWQWGMLAAEALCHAEGCHCVTQLLLQCYKAGCPIRLALQPCSLPGLDAGEHATMTAAQGHRAQEQRQAGP